MKNPVIRPWTPHVGDPPSEFIRVALAEFEVRYEAYRWREKGGTDRRAFHADLETAEELAFRNQLYAPDAPFADPFYLPCLDFAASELDAEIMRRLRGRAFEMHAPIHLFATGRSFHGYCAKATTYPEWVRFLGSMLLLNRLDAPPTVDARWIGHKLRCGYATLRLTANTERHSHPPRYVCTAEPTAGCCDPADDYE